MDTLAVRLVVPLAGPALDFNQPVSAPCWAHNEKSHASWTWLCIQAAFAVPFSAMRETASQNVPIKLATFGR
jgi:hypothetical protein